MAVEPHHEPAHHSHKLPVRREDTTSWRIYKPSYGVDDFRMLLDSKWNALARKGNHLAVEVRQMTHALPLMAARHAVTVLPDGDPRIGKIATCFFTCFPEAQSKKAIKAARDAKKKKKPAAEGDPRGQVMSILAGLPGESPCVETLRQFTRAGDVVVALALEASIAVGTGLAAAIKCGTPSSMIAKYIPSAVLEDRSHGELEVPLPEHDGRLHRSVLSYMGNGQVLLIGDTDKIKGLVKGGIEAAPPAAEGGKPGPDGGEGAAAAAEPAPRVSSARGGAAAVPLKTLGSILEGIGGVNMRPGQLGVKYSAAKMAADGAALAEVASCLEEAGVFGEGEKAPDLSKLKVKLRPRLLMCFYGRAMDGWGEVAVGGAVEGEVRAGAAVARAEEAEGMMSGREPLEHLREAATSALRARGSDGSGEAAAGGGGGGSEEAAGGAGGAGGGGGAIGDVEAVRKAGSGEPKEAAGDEDIHATQLRRSARCALLTYEVTQPAEAEGAWSVTLNLPGGKRRFAETDWGCAMRHLRAEAGIEARAVEEAGLRPVARELVDPQSTAGGQELELLRLFVYAD